MELEAWRQRGCDAFVKAFNSGQSLCEVFRLYGQEFGEPGARAAYLGAFGVAASIVDFAKAAPQCRDKVPETLRPGAESVMVRANGLLFRKEFKQFTALGNDLLLCAETFRKLQPNAKLSLGTAEKKDNEVKPAAPMEVIVKSMPARETTTKVRRDADGNITGSVQIENDAAA